MSDHRWIALEHTFAELTKVSDAWRSTEWSELLRGMLHECERVAANREVLGEGRKQISARTRDFGRLDESARLGELPHLLRMYQNYIDDLTKSVKALETSYSTLYATLGRLPDPAGPMFGMCRESVVVDTFKEVERSLGVAQAQVAELTSELSTLKNQESTLASLREQVSRHKENEVAAGDLQSDVRALQAREMTALKELRSAQIALEAERNSVMAAQKELLEWRTRAEEGHNATDMQCAILANELEATQALVSTLERENAKLRRGPQPAIPVKHNDEAEALVITLHNELSQTQTALSATVSAREALERRCATLEETIRAKAEKEKARLPPLPVPVDTSPTEEDSPALRLSVKALQADCDHLRSQLVASERTCEQLRESVLQLGGGNLGTSEDLTLGVLAAQRERYKQKAITAEQQYADLSLAHDALRQECLGLQSDNSFLASKLHAFQQMVLPEGRASVGEAHALLNLPGTSALRALWSHQRVRTLVLTYVVMIHILLILKF